MLRLNRLLPYVLLVISACVMTAGAIAADDPPTAVGPLMKLFKSGRLPAERVGTVAEMICTRGNEHDLRVIFDRITQADGFAPELRLKAMGWLTDAATTRKVKPTGDLSALDQLITGDSAAKQRSLQLAAIKLASTWKEVAIADDLQRLAVGENTDAAIRRAAITGLVAIGDPSSIETLRKLTGQPYPTAIRMQAVAGLVGADLPAAAAAAAEVFAQASVMDDPTEMLNAFFNRKDGTDELAAALKQKMIAVDVAKRALRQMYSVGRSDAALSDVLSLAAGIATDPDPPTPADVAKLVEEVHARGNAERGEAIFRRAEVSCMRCHSVSRAGGQVGPELSAVGGSSPTDYIVNSILNPNLAVKEQYVTKVFVLVDGMVLTGVVVDRDEVKVRIRDANGQIVTVPTADIEEEVEGKSLMPQGLTKFLTHDELIDLIKFVSDLGKAGPYAIPTTPRIQRWRRLTNPPPELTDDVPHLEHVRQYILGSQPADWVPAYARVAGVLPLAELRNSEGPPVLILQGEVDVTAEGKLAVNIVSTETTQVWVDANPFDARQAFEVSLPPGRHKITVRVALSQESQPELKVELTKPEGSAIQFDVVGGA